MAARDAYLERVRDWADQTVEILVALNRLCASAGESASFAADRQTLLTRLSAQIEKGRWFFPNVLDEHVGNWKQAAYRGIRQPILDHLVEAFNAASEVDHEDAGDACSTLIECQRTFVSEIQLRLDPKRRDVEYQTLVDRYQDLDRYVPTYSSLHDE